MASDPDATRAVVPPPPPPPLGGSLHPAAIGVWSARQAGVLVFLVVVNPAMLVLAVPVLALSVVASVVRWLRFRWRLEGDALVIEQGLVQQQRRVIPLERVQGVDVVRRPTHRVLGVVALHVEAIGGSQTEGVLDALSPAVADRLRHVLLARSGEPETGGGRQNAAGAELAAVAPGTLVTAGLTEANAGVLAAVLGGAWQLFGDRIEALARLVPRLQDTAAAVVVFGVLLAGVLALFVAAQVVAFWGFLLTREGDDLRIRRGLLEQRLDTIPLRRVQAVRIEENLLRRLIGQAAVKVDVAGRPGGGGETGTLLPLGPRAEAVALAATVLDVPALPEVDLAPMPTRARTRRLVRAGVAVAVLAAASSAVFGLSGLAALLLLVPAGAAAEASYRALGWAEMEGHVVARAGLWTRRTAVVPVSRLQSLSVHATLPQRWRHLATVDLEIARSPGVWGGPQLVDLDVRAAMTLVDRLRTVV